VLTGISDDRLAIAALQQGAQSYMKKDDLHALELGRVLRQSIERHDFVSRLREADRAIALRERRFRALVEHSNDLTLLVDREGGVTYMSPMAARTLLLKQVDPEQLKLSALVHQEDEEMALACLHQALRDPEAAIPITLRARTKRGPMEVWMEGTLTNLLDVTGVNALVANLHDITLRHHAERELQRANMDLEHRVEERTHELNLTKEELHEALETERRINDVKTRFVSTASHEFRTPLTGIRSSADLIARYNAEIGHEKIAVHADRIREKVSDLTAILDEFLSLEKLEKGLERCEPEDFDLMGLCRAVVEEMQPLARDGQHITWGGEQVSMQVRLDRRMVANALRNLLSNSIKYSQESTVILLSCTTAVDRVRLEVTDQGIGIPLEDQPHLFDRFFRASNTGATQGTGLGLPIVRRYLDIMKGTITFNSRPGEGSTFVLDLPRSLPQD